MGTQILILGEYDAWFVSRADGSLNSVVSGPVKGAPKGILGGSGGLHHSAFIGPDRAVWVQGENANNITATGIATNPVGFTKTPVGNAKQVACYSNGGSGLGDGVGVLTMDGKLIIIGCTQSGFRGDGTEGNAGESSPYQVATPEPIQKIQVGTYFFALGVSGKVYRWGGTRKDPYWVQFSCGAGVANPVLTKIAVAFSGPSTTPFPEPIKDIVGGDDFSYAIGVSGKIYGWAYDMRFLGLANSPQQLKWMDLTAVLNLRGTLVKLAKGCEATYALMDSGDIYAWGNNTQAAIGNGLEAAYVQQTKGADWGVTARSLWQITPVKINPAGVAFVDITASINDAFYVYYEDTTGVIWANGRNKGGVIPDGKDHGTSDQQAATPNAWDVLSPTKLSVFPAGAVVTPPPPVNQAPLAVIGGIVPLTWPANGMQLDGTGSKDADGTVTAYKWTVPAGVIISDATTAKPMLLFPAPGVYPITLGVLDNSGASGSVTTQIIINNAPAARKVASFLLTLLGQAITANASNAKFTFDDGSTQ